MRRIRYTARQTDLTAPEIWQAMRVPGDRAGASQLRAAIRQGKAGRHAEGFTLLGAYHREALAEAWAQIQADQAEAPEPDHGRVQEVVEHRLRCHRNEQMIAFGPKIDWFPEHALQGASISGFQQWAWVRPAVAAYVRTGDVELGRCLAGLIEQYDAVRLDPRWHGEACQRYRNYVFHQLPVAARLPSFLAIYLGMLNAGEAGPGLVEAMARQLLAAGRVIVPQNREFAAHNIQTHGCRALLTIARLFPEFREARQWDRFACLRLRQQVTEGYDSDGCQAERTWCYAAATLDSISESYDLAMRLGGLGGDEAAFLRGIRRAYRFYARTVGPRPTLRMPSYGDAHEGSSAAAILASGRKYFPRGTDADFGVDRTRSCLLKTAGFAIFRNGDDDDAVYMDLNFGRFAGWHSHYDLLSMNMFAYGRPVLDELCRFGPYSIALDPVFRAPEAHNLLLIDGMVYDNRNVAGEGVRWYSDPRVDYFTATHRAYRYFCFGREAGHISPNIEASVRRTVVFVKDPGYAVVLDSVTDISSPRSFGRAISQRWHSPMRFKSTGAKVARTAGRGPGVVLAWAHAEGLQPLACGTDFTANSMAYGPAHDRHHLVARRWPALNRTAGINGFATLLFPFKSAPPAVDFRALPGPAHAMWRAEGYSVAWGDRKDVLVLNPECEAGLEVEGQAVTGLARFTLGSDVTIEVPA